MRFAWCGRNPQRARSALKRCGSKGRRRIHWTIRLAASLGHLGNPQHADVQKAMQDAPRRLKAGKPAGILTGNEEERAAIDWGYQFVAVGADVGLLARNADALAKKFKSG